jgi:hypothetical protein
MGLFILRRVGVMILTALCLTFVVFFLTNLYPNLEKLAKTQGNARMTDAEVASWLDRNGYGGPMILRYGQWLGVVPGWTREAEMGPSSPGAASTAAWNRARRPRFCGLLQGDLGYSTVSADEVATIIGGRLQLTGILMFWAFAVMVPCGAACGGARGHARGQSHGPKSVDLRHRLDRDAGIRVGRHLHRASGVLHRGPLALAGRKRLDRRTHAVPGLRPLGDGRRDQLLELHPAGVDHRALRHGLHRADDARLHGRGDDRPVHPHRAAQGRELQATSS